MPLDNPNAQRIIGVLILLAGVVLIIASQDARPLGTVIGAVLMAVGFWLSYVKNEIAKMRRNRNKEQ